MVTANRFALQLESTHDSTQRIVINAHEYDFGVDPPTNCTDEICDVLRQFGETHPLADTSLIDKRVDMSTDLLIGIDQMYKIVHLNSERTIAPGLVAKASRFGWIVSGSCGPKAARGDVVRVKPTCCPAASTRPARDVERSWKLNAIGVSDSGTEDADVAEEWVHVDGKHNIADIASRGVSANDLIEESESCNAPLWLADLEEQRPVRRPRPGRDRTESVSEELRLQVAPVVVSPPLVNFDRFGSWGTSVSCCRQRSSLRTTLPPFPD